VLAVAGTHGKTTTTAMLTWILEQAGLQPGFLIGGVPLNFGVSAKLGQGRCFVIEADEYDTAFFDKRSKFVHYRPRTAILNNLEFDHADIFQSLEEIQTSFRRLVQLVPENGALFVNADEPNALAVTTAARSPVYTVGFSETATHRILNPRYGSGARFSFMNLELELQIPGEFNVRNAAMAAAAAHFHGVAPEIIQSALASFEGVARRQEVRGTVNGITVVDDFGHHPTALGLTIDALRHQYPGRRLWAVFEPRSNTTRRAVFQQSLPEALGKADAVILSKVARLEQLPENDRLDPRKIVDDISGMGKPAHYEEGVEEIVQLLQREARPGDLIAIFSNGGFDNIHERLLRSLETIG
jgi:UDP-N-acetylmuramate: L-alanyl-gamma-D-glutamyl-meso-diaminopimelate ligase